MISKPERESTLVTVAFWSIAIGLGLFRLWVMRHYMNPDGVSYLDMGDAFWRGDWKVAINTYWSPLYAWLASLILLILEPSPYWEFTGVQILNFVVYLIALLCFGFFWRELHAWQKSRCGQDALTWPDWSWMLLGYGMAIWTAFRLIGLEFAHPDMLFAGFAYLAFGLAVRIRRESLAWSVFALLGLVLGLGYLAKSPMFPLAFVFLSVALLSTGDWKRGVPQVLLALFVFLMVAGPFVISLSLSRRQFTFGESGRVHYQMFYEEGKWQFAEERKWRFTGEAHDLEAPLPIEVATREGVTYLPFYVHTDMSMPAASNSTLWSKLGRYMVRWTESANEYYQIVILKQGHLVAGILILLFMGHGWKPGLRGILQNWHVLIPACAALGAYGLLIVQARYIAPFVLVFWGGILSAIQLRDTPESKRLFNAVSVVVTLIFAIQLCAFLNRYPVEQLRTPGHPHWEVAQTLSQLGLQPGDKVGVIGKGEDALWARLGRFSVAGEISPRGAGVFWLATPESRRKSLEAFGRVGAKAVVVEIWQPRGLLPEVWRQRAIADGWHKVGNTDKYVYRLPSDWVIEKASGGAPRSR